MLLVVPEDYFIQELLVESCIRMGFKGENIVLSGGASQLEGRKFTVCYVTEGNTFEVLAYMRKNGLVDYVKECVRNGGTYIGSSAGALIAGKDIYAALDFDANICGMKDYKALDLLEGRIVIPHYTYRQLEKYLSGFVQKEKYKEIKNVADNEMLIYEVVVDGDNQRVIKEKRIRKGV